MRIREIIWIEEILEKIQTKHGVSAEEAEGILERARLVRFIERGHVKGENVYAAFGQTAAGRYLVVLFIAKEGARALPISARDMTAKERRLYARQKKGKA